MADVRRALVKKTSEKLIGSHDADELVSDREMVALGIGMNCADMIMRGKLDVMDLEAWTLRRWTFSGREAKAHTVTLNKALDTSLM